MATELKDIPVYRKGDRINATGFYGERLGRQLLHLKLPSWDHWLTHHADNHFDFIDEEGIRAQVEMKMCNNKDRIVIYADQMESQLGVPSFPVEDKVTMLVHYRNQGPRELRVNQEKGGTFLYLPRLLPRLMQKTENRNWNSLSGFFSFHIYRADVIDTNLLKRWSAIHGTREFTRMGKDNPMKEHCPPRPIVCINHRDIHHLVSDTRTSLAELGMQEDEIALWLPPEAKQSISRQIATTLDGNPLSFKLNILLANGMKQRFLRRLNGNVVKSPPPEVRQLTPAFA